jgi:hypothetical protein
MLLVLQLEVYGGRAAEGLRLFHRRFAHVRPYALIGGPHRIFHRCMVTRTARCPAPAGLPPTLRRPDPTKAGSAGSVLFATSVPHLDDAAAAFAGSISFFLCAPVSLW